MNSPDTTRDPAVGPIGGSGVSSWRRSAAIALSALGVIVLLFYDRLWWPGLALVKRDAVRFFLPLKRYASERLAAGELPHWFPYEGMGRPFLGVPNTGVFHPFTALYLWLPAPDAYRLTVLLSCLTAAFGTFALARLLSISRTGALLGGVAFACSGYVVSLTENVVYLYSICLLPLFFLGLEKMRDESPAWLVVPALVWASVFLHGDVQTGYYYGFMAVLWSATRWQGARRRTGLRLIMATVLAALLAGIQLAPTAALYFDSERRLPSFIEYVYLWSTHPLRLAGLVAAPVWDAADHVEIARYFFGGRPPGDPPVGFWSESIYLGVPVAGLAMIGGWFRRDLRGLCLLGGLALLLSLGKYGGLYDVFYHLLPFWSSFRYPERLMGIVAFSASLLAGAGVDALRQGRGGPVPWLLAAGLCAAFGAGLLTEAAGAWAAEASGAPAALARKVVEASARAFLFSAIASASVAAIVTGMRRAAFRQEWLSAALLVIVALDLSRANQGAYHTAPVEVVTAVPALAGALGRDAEASGIGKFRVLSIKGAEGRYPESAGQALDSAGLSSLVLRQSLEVETNSELGVESIKVYLPGYPRATATMIELARKKFSSQTYARYNVGYFISRTGNFRDGKFARAIVATAPEYDLVLVRNPYPVKPRAYLASRPEPTRGPVDLEALIARPEFFSGEIDVVETEEDALPASTRDGAVTISRYAPEEVAIHVETPVPAVLVLLDAFDAGWQARLESGERLPIMRANGLVRAVLVPGGSHTVTFFYRTPFLKEGIVLSLLGMALSLAVLARAGWARGGGAGFARGLPAEGGVRRDVSSWPDSHKSIAKEDKTR